MIKRSREIDGLRTLAILPVIFCHAGFSSFSGGFIGVDVFFVISGYLISKIIVSDFADNKFSFWRFYRRRAVRLLPVLFAVVLSCILVFWFFMTPAQLHQFSRSIVGLSFFSSNVVFWLESGYFDLRSVEKPLLHTWSLGVEEQFYFVFPLLFVFLLRSTKNYRFLVVLLVMLAGLLASYYFSKIYPNASFYLFISRIWEFLIGVAAVLVQRRTDSINKPLSTNLLSITGLLMIVASVCVVQFREFVHPGFITLLPCVGTALVVLFARNNNLVSRLLSTFLFVEIGLISYSAYLWHHPVFVFDRFMGINSIPAKWLSIAVVFILSYLSFKFVEQPFRFKIPFNLRKYFLVWAGILLFGIVAYRIDWTGWFKFRLNDAQRIAFNTASPSPYRNTCHSLTDTSQVCHFFHDSVTWAVLGDSHGIELAYMLAKKLDHQKEGVIQSTNSSPPCYTFSSGSNTNDQWMKNSVLYLLNHPEIRHVLLAWRHSSYLFGNNEDYFPDTVDKKQVLYIKNGNSVEEKRKLYMESFCALANKLKDAGKEVTILLPVPEQGNHVYYFLGKMNDQGSVSGVSLAYYQARNRYFFEHLTGLHQGIAIVDPLKELGSQGNSTFVIQHDSSLYFDDNHLSLTGAKRVVDGLKK